MVGFGTEYAIMNSQRQRTRRKPIRPGGPSYDRPNRRHLER